MLALLISDLHGNLPAHQAVLAAAPQHDVVWNLGDVVGYGANPNEVVELARNLGGIVVRGNHDRACSGTMDYYQFRNLSWLASYSADWTDQVLTQENKQWLSKLRRGPLRQLGSRVLCAHGMPKNEDEYLRGEEGAMRALRASRAWITFLGHTHMHAGYNGMPPAVTRLCPHLLEAVGADHPVDGTMRSHRRSVYQSVTDEWATNRSERGKFPHSQVFHALRVQVTNNPFSRIYLFRNPILEKGQRSCWRKSKEYPFGR